MDDFLFVLLQEGPLENLPQSEKSWLDYTKSKKSFILHLFYGQIKSTVKCTVCNKESHTYETFSNLSLELPPSNNRCSLDVSKLKLMNGQVTQSNVSLGDGIINCVLILFSSLLGMLTIVLCWRTCAQLSLFKL